MGGPRKCAKCGAKAKESVLFKFPKDPEKRQQWADFCSLQSPKNFSRLCERHFAKHDILNPEIAPRIRPGSIPTIEWNPPTPSKATWKTKSETVQQAQKEIRDFEVIDCGPSVICTTLSGKYAISLLDVHKPLDPMAISLNHDHQYVQQVRTDINRKADPLGPENVDDDLESQAVIVQDQPGVKRERFEKKVVPESRKTLSSQCVGSRNTPRKKARIVLKKGRRVILAKERKMHNLKMRNIRVRKSLKSVSDVLKTLQMRTPLSDHAIKTLQVSMPSAFKSTCDQWIRKGYNRMRPCPAEMIMFYRSISFYSMTAYKYLRALWKRALPHPSTLPEWYTVENGQPGFSESAFDTLGSMAEMSTVIVNLVLDEMPISKYVEFANSRMYGFVDVGVGFGEHSESDNNIPARSALVLMAVALNNYWKMPLGYFLINDLTTSELANIIQNTLTLLHDRKVDVFSITTDGAAANISMCVSLGANFDYGTPNFRPWFAHPCSSHPVYVMWDPCRMIKLVRNAFGESEPFQDGNNGEISWLFIRQLQDNIGLSVENKISKRHILYQEEPTDVSLAAQVLSNSVSVALKALQQNGHEGFQNSEATAEFCSVMNNIFDILNCRKQSLALNESNFDQIKELATKYEVYLANLTCSVPRIQKERLPVLKSPRKTGFLGLIICLRNIFHIFKATQPHDMSFLLTFKLSLDPLDKFFCEIRQQGKFDREPTCRQFMTAYDAANGKRRDQGCPDEESLS